MIPLWALCLVGVGGAVVGGLFYVFVFLYDHNHPASKYPDPSLQPQQVEQQEEEGGNEAVTAAMATVTATDTPTTTPTTPTATHKTTMIKSKSKSILKKSELELEVYHSVLSGEPPPPHSPSRRDRNLVVSLSPLHGSYRQRNSNIGSGRNLNLMGTLSASVVDYICC